MFLETTTYITRASRKNTKIHVIQESNEKWNFENGMNHSNLWCWNLFEYLHFSFVRTLVLPLNDNCVVRLKTCWFRCFWLADSSFLFKTTAAKISEKNVWKVMNKPTKPAEAKRKKRRWSKKCFYETKEVKTKLAVYQIK